MPFPCITLEPSWLFALIAILTAVTILSLSVTKPILHFLSERYRQNIESSRQQIELDKRLERLKLELEDRSKRLDIESKERIIQDVLNSIQATGNSSSDKPEERNELFTQLISSRINNLHFFTDKLDSYTKECDRIVQAIRDQLNKNQETVA